MNDDINDPLKPTPRKKGKPMGVAKTDPIRLNAAQRRVRLLRWRSAGKSIAEIADMEGVSAERVRQLLNKAFEVLRKEQVGLAQEVRDHTLKQLDELLTAVWDKAVGEEPDLEAVRTALSVIQARTKLLGGDAPSKLTVTGHSIDLSGLSEAELQERARAMGLKTDS